MRILVWVILLANSACTNDLPLSCGGLAMMNVQSVITQAIANARAALERQKTMNQHLSVTGFDEPANPTAYSPKTYHQHYAAFSHLNHAASIQVDSGFIVNYATKEITETLGIGVDDLHQCAGVLETWHQLISPFCIRRSAMCDPSASYRTIDGSCNNLQNPLWGRSNRPHRRFLKPHYMDDISVPRQLSMTGEYLPSARTVSNVIHNQDPCCPLMERDLSLYVMQWGQMLDHDITDTAIAKGANDATIMCCNVTQDLLMRRSECFPIPIPQGDQRFSEPCMNFVRSVAGHDDDCKFGRRNQLNQATSFLDASFLYGHNDKDADEIRSHVGGTLRMAENDVFPPGVEDLTHCELDNLANYCMKSGDFRIHVMPGLTAIQILFLREHNRIAAILRSMNPHLCDEDLYQQTRKIIIAEVQHITYSQWLPHVLGETMPRMLGLTPTSHGHNAVYDSTVDPTISNVFGVSAFRFGHTLLQDTVLFMKDQGTMIHNEMAFNRPDMIFQDQAQGCSFVGKGLSLHASSQADEKIVNSVRNNLFLDINGRSFDLISLNIQRGRDHGVQGYNAWRKFCGLPYAFHFGTGPGGLIHHRPDIAMKMASIYRHPDDIDVFPGGMSETPVEGAVLGPLFSCIVGQQFYNLKAGDRFYYENPDTMHTKVGFTEGQLNSIKTMTLAKLICLHFHMGQVQMDPFRMPSNRNPMVDCRMFEDLDFTQWNRL